MSRFRFIRDRMARRVVDVLAAAAPRLRRTTERDQIAVFLFWGIGDAVLTTPCLRALRTAYPQAHIVAIGKPWLADLLGDEGLIDEYVTLVPPWTRPQRKYRLWSAEWRAFASAARQLSQRRFDLLVSLRPDPRETVLARLITAAEFAGYAGAGGSGWIDVDLGRDITSEPGIYRGELAAIAAERLLGTQPPAEPGLKLLPPPAAVVSQLSAAGYRAGPVLVVAFGAAHPIRRWTVEGIGRTLAALERPPGAYLLIDSDDSPRVEPPSNAPAVRWRGSLAELRRVLPLADVVFCSDSGTMHMAAALGCRVVAVFGPTSLGGFAPRGPQHSVYAVEPMPCRPCYNACIYPSPLCMDSIETGAVAARIDASLAAVGQPRAAIAHRLAV